MPKSISEPTASAYSSLGGVSVVEAWGGCVFVYGGLDPRGGLSRWVVTGHLREELSLGETKQ